MSSRSGGQDRRCRAPSASVLLVVLVSCGPPPPEQLFIHPESPGLPSRSGRNLEYELQTDWAYGIEVRCSPTERAQLLLQAPSIDLPAIRFEAQPLDPLPRGVVVAMLESNVAELTKEEIATKHVETQKSRRRSSRSSRSRRSRRSVPPPARSFDMVGRVGVYLQSNHELLDSVDVAWATAPYFSETLTLTLSTEGEGAVLMTVANGFQDCEGSP